MAWFCDALYCTALHRSVFCSSFVSGDSRLIISLDFNCRFEVIRQTAIAAEPKWAPSDGAKWDEKDYEKELKKLEKEAEDRLDKKIDELMKKIETTGAAK
jgi:hypothetical protein